MLPLGRRDVRDLLEDYEAWAGLAAHWMVFGSGGHLRRPPAGVTRSYTDGLCLHHHIKSLVQPQWVLKPLSPHHFAYAEGRFCVNEDRVPVLGASSYPVAEKIRINHYFYTSQQDVEEKVQRGLATAVYGSDGWTLGDFYRQSSRTGTPDTAIAPFPLVRKTFSRMPPEESPPWSRGIARPALKRKSRPSRPWRNPATWRGPSGAMPGCAAIRPRP